MALILQDFFTFPPSAGRAGGASADPAIRELATSGKGLKVTFVASHAGMVNGNRVMYAPSGMKDSSHTWVYPQARPVQVHHDNHADPIGRVIGARYAGYEAQDVSEGQSDALQLFVDNLKLTKDNVVEIARNLEDSKVLDQMDWRGVGELILDAIVTDADAIEKILDGRYLGVSVTQRPQQAFCSICGVDWVKDDPCEHERGEKDEDSERVMYLIVGNTDYVEISYVNSPADKHAMGISAQSINQDPTAPTSFDGKVDASSILDRSMLTTVSFQLVDALNEEIGMSLKNKDKTQSDGTAPKEQDAKDSTEEIKDTQNASEVSPQTEPVEQSQSEQNQKDSKEEDTPAENTSSDEPNSSDPQATIEEALQCLFEDRDNITGFMCDLLFEAQQELVEEDAKLSTEKRKSMPGSSFCGPNRSFPVNDCDHYTAAKRLLGRYKGPGDKSAIMSCIERKGKSLGCSSSKKEDEQDEIAQQDNFSIESLSDEALTSTLLDAEKLMVERGLKAERKCERCDELSAQITELNDSVPELQDTAKVLREEYKTVVSEHIASEDAHASTLSEFNSTLQTFVLDCLLLTDKETSEDDLKARVKAISFEDLKKIAAETDLSEVISFVRSGLTQDPEETITQDDAEPVEENSIDPTLKLSESLVKFYKGHGSQFACQVLSDWINGGKLPEDFTLDKAFELVAK